MLSPEQREKLVRAYNKLIDKQKEGYLSEAQLLQLMEFTKKLYGEGFSGAVGGKIYSVGQYYGH